MDDSIVLQIYSPEWPNKAQTEISRILAAIPNNIVRGIAHIGSTSVVGCKAKPIIDIAISVDNIADGLAAVQSLEGLDYLFWSDNPDKTHMFFVKGMPPAGLGRTHHLHFFEKARFDAHIKFREILNSQESILREYQDLKENLAAKYRNDREAYTRLKGEFINKVLSAF
jgi:GrpB-like predicted nucleotidyltransferase (UPF0157 family)